MKRISPATVTVAVLAVVFGLIAANMAKQALHQPVAVVEAPPAPHLYKIVVARVNMTAHTRIRPQDVQIIEVPKQQVPDGAFAAEAIAFSRVTRQTVMAGVPILEQALFPIGEAPTLAELIPAGQRALTIEIDGSTPGGSLIEPESLIDISLTVTGEHPEIGGVATKTLMQGVKVIASPGTNLNGGDRNMLIVAVTSEQANQLITAQEAGTLSVTLRNAEDLAVNDRTLHGGLISRDDLLGLTIIEPPLVPQPYRVERWSGGKMQIIEIGRPRVEESEAATIADDDRNEPCIILPASFGQSEAQLPSSS